MISHRVKLAVLAAGLIAVSLPLDHARAAEADVRISVPKPEAGELISPMPDSILIDPTKANEKPRQEKISKSANRVVESDDWRKDTKDKIWKYHKQGVVYLNCSSDELILRTYNIEDGVRIVPRWSVRLKPGERTKGTIGCGTKKNPGKCDFYIGTKKHGFLSWTGLISSWGPNVIFGTAQHFARYTTTPNAVSAGCRSFKNVLLLTKSGGLPIK